MDEETAKTKGREFLSFPHLYFVEIINGLIIRAQDILDQYNVKTRDTIHLATALASGASTFITFDGRLNGLGVTPFEA